MSCNYIMLYTKLMHDDSTFQTYKSYLKLYNTSKKKMEAKQLDLSKGKGVYKVSKGE